jgi:hypothetical protein
VAIAAGPLRHRDARREEFKPARLPDIVLKRRDRDGGTGEAGPVEPAGSSRPAQLSGMKRAARTIERPGLQARYWVLVTPSGFEVPPRGGVVYLDANGHKL